VNGDPILHAAPEKMNFEIAVKHIPTSRLFEAQLDLADGNRQQALSGFFPTLDFTAGISLTDQHLLPESNRLWSLGLSLNLPLFNGLKTYHDLRSTKALEIAAHRNQDANEFENLTLLKQTLATYQESEVKLRVDQNALKAATVRATIARKRYNNGLLNFEQWDIIESDLINRQKAAITSKRERINAESAYMQALGEGDLP